VKEALLHLGQERGGAGLRDVVGRAVSLEDFREQLFSRGDDAVLQVRIADDLVPARID
jgi:hypothetical protein